jgi:mono/diheme cytochrome c family protein
MRREAFKVFGIRWMVCLAAAFAAGCGPSGHELGRALYHDGVGLDGRLAWTQGPDWLRFAGAGCAVCHGDRGQGLTAEVSGVTGVAPAVTWEALQARGYDAAMLRHVLVTGIDPHGRELHYYMPRWVLSDAEADALIGYLRTL